MTEIEEMPNPKATTIIPDRCLWVCLYWYEGVSWPMSMCHQDRAQAIKYALEARRDETKPLKLYRLDY